MRRSHPYLPGNLALTTPPTPPARAAPRVAALGLAAVLSLAGCRDTTGTGDWRKPPPPTLTVEVLDSSPSLLDTVRVRATATEAGRPAEGITISWSTWQLGYVGTAMVPVIVRSLPPTTTDANGQATIELVPSTGAEHYLAASSGELTDTVDIHVDRTPAAYDGLSWSPLPDAPVPGWFVGAAVFGDGFYVVGYFDNGQGGLGGCVPAPAVARTLEYDLGAGSWIERTPAPAHDTMFVGFFDYNWAYFDPGLAAATSTGIHLLFGPYHHFYDPAGDRWTDLAPPPVDPARGTLTAIGDSLFLVAEDGHVAMYVQSTDGWSLRSPRPGGSLPGAAATALDGDIYVAGGGADWGGVTDFDRYDVAADRWTHLAPMPLARTTLAAGTIAGRVCVWGGGFPLYRNSYEFPETYCYDPASDRWTAGPSLPVPGPERLDELADILGSAAASRGDTVYVVGGGASLVQPACAWEFGPAAYRLTVYP